MTFQTATLLLSEGIIANLLAPSACRLRQSLPRTPWTRGWETL